MSTKENGYDWTKELPYAITVCDTNGIIIYMNELSAKTFAKYGDTLIGRSLYEFHGERATGMIRKMLADGSTNS